MADTDEEKENIEQNEDDNTQSEQKTVERSDEGDQSSNKESNQDDDPKEETSEGIVQLKYNSRSSTSLKPVLAEYGLPYKEEKHVQFKEKKKKKPASANSAASKQKKKNEFGDDIDEREIERNRAKREHYMQVYDEVHQLRDFMREDYMDRLGDKIQKQRVQIQKKTEQMHGKIRRKEEEEKEASHRVNKRLDRVELSSDNTFLRSLPKTQYYKFVGLEQKLIAKGKLRTQPEYEAFRQSVGHPALMRKYELMASDAEHTDYSGDKTGNLSTEPSLLQSATSSMVDYENEKSDKVPDFNPLSQIEESKEPSRPGTMEHKPNWGKESTIGSKSARKRDPYAIARQAAIELDKKYPQKELPPMSCFTLDIGDKPPDPEQMMLECEQDRREKERRLFIKRLRKMYNLSQSNTANMHRLFAKHEGEFEMSVKGPEVNSLISANEFSPVILQHEDDGDKIMQHQPWLRHIKHRTIQPIEEASQESSGRDSQGSRGSAKSRDSAGSRVKSRGSKRSSAASKTGANETTLPPVPPPLSLNSLQGNNKVVEAKCLSSYWSNYLAVGKSVFAK